MRLDAARLKGCFGSWIPLWSCYPVKQSSNSARPERTRLPGRVFHFWRSLYRPMDRVSSPLILKTWNFFALKPFSGQIAPFSRSKKPPRRPSRRGGSSREATEGFGGRSTLNKALRPETAKQVEGLCVAYLVHHSTMGGILQALDLEI